MKIDFQIRPASDATRWISFHAEVYDVGHTELLEVLEIIRCAVEKKGWKLE